jgi:hypothetical protein
MWKSTPIPLVAQFADRADARKTARARSRGRRRMPPTDQPSLTIPSPSASNVLSGCAAVPNCALPSAFWAAPTEMPASVPRKPYW